MLTVSTSEVFGSLAFSLLVAATTHAVYWIRSRGNRERQLRGRYASACIGIGTFVGMIAAINVNPGFSTLPLFSGMFGGWYVARQMGLHDTTHKTLISGTEYVMDPKNPYSPPGVPPMLGRMESGEPDDGSKSLNEGP